MTTSKMSYDFDVCNKGYLKLLQEKLIGKNPHAIVSVCSRLLPL